MSGAPVVIDARPTLLARARFALTFYREDMQRHAATVLESPGARRTYPYGIDVENELRALLGEPGVQS